MYGIHGHKMQRRLLRAQTFAPFCQQYVHTTGSACCKRSVNNICGIQGGGSAGAGPTAVGAGLRHQEDVAEEWLARKGWSWGGQRKGIWPRKGLEIVAESAAVSCAPSLAGQPNADLLNSVLAQ